MGANLSDGALLLFLCCFFFSFFGLLHSTGLMLCRRRSRTKCEMMVEKVEKLGYFQLALRVLQTDDVRWSSLKSQVVARMVNIDASL